MLICLDVGNTHICGGVFNGPRLLAQFRHATSKSITSDQFGVFLKNIIREYRLDAEQITAIAICSVVPSIDYSLRAACTKYFNLEPFIMQPGIETGLTIKTKDPKEVGSDLVAGALAALELLPNQPLIILDLGTVTTIVAVSENRELLGASFIPGLNTAMHSLSLSAAKLFPVEITRPRTAVGRDTTESLQSGLFFGHLGALREIIRQIAQQLFPTEAPVLIATGGFAGLFKEEALFNHIEPNLVLNGIRLAYCLNHPTSCEACYEA